MARIEPQPEVHIRGDSNVRYQFVGQVLVATQQIGIRKVAFITDPGSFRSAEHKLGRRDHDGDDSRRSSEGQSYSDINMTPLIDVMLVLLIIFIITLPTQTHAVKIDNPLPPPPTSRRRRRPR